MGTDSDTTIRTLMDAALAFRDERDWKQFHKPKDLVLGLGIEVGELAELLLWRSEAEIQAQLEAPDWRQRASEELADVLMFLLYLAEALDIDLTDAALRKMKLTAAKYPVEKALGSAQKYTELDRGN